MPEEKKILICGDPHGYFEYAARSAEMHGAEAVIFAGDQCPSRPLEEIVSRYGFSCPVYYILGNHDSDREEWLENHLGMQEQNLHCRIKDIAGIKVAALGGVFRASVWHPRQEESPRFYTRKDLLAHARPQTRFRQWLPRKHWTTIFPEDLDSLRAQGRADVLLCHEAPSTHRHGFREIDHLAGDIGVQMIIHGHHHRHYQARLENGIQVVGLGISSAGMFVLSTSFLEKQQHDEKIKPEKMTATD